MSWVEKVRYWPLDTDEEIQLGGDILDVDVPDDGLGGALAVSVGCHAEKHGVCMSEDSAYQGPMVVDLGKVTRGIDAKDRQEAKVGTHSLGGCGWDPTVEPEMLHKCRAFAGGRICGLPWGHEGACDVQEAFALPDYRNVGGGQEAAAWFAKRTSMGLDLGEDEQLAKRAILEEQRRGS